MKNYCARYNEVGRNITVRDPKDCTRMQDEVIITAPTDMDIWDVRRTLNGWCFDYFTTQGKQ